MPRIIRWFKVSHDINHSPTIRMLVAQYGAPSLRIWLEILSISDRAGPYIDCTSEGAIRRLSSAAETRFKVVSSVIDALIKCDSLRIHDSINHVTEVVNYWDYHTSREANKLPTRHDKTDITDKTIKNKHTTVTKVEPKPWPPEDLWLKNLIEQQPHFQHAVEPLSDFAWWEDIATALNGIEPSFIQPEFSKMSAWLRENPGRRPTTKGARRFIRSWLERARENQRRLYAVKKWRSG